MRIRRGLAALLALLMLLTLAPSAMMEEEVSLQDLEEDWAVEPEAGLAEDWAVEPEVGLAEDAGDTGLTVEFEDVPAGDEAFEDAPFDGSELPADDFDGDADDAPVEADEESADPPVALYAGPPERQAVRQPAVGRHTRRNRGRLLPRRRHTAIA